MKPVPNAIEQSECVGVNWTTPDAVAEVEVGVQPPSEALVEALGPIDVGDGDRYDLELHVDRPRCGRSGEAPVLASVVLMRTSLDWVAASCRRPARPSRP